MMPFFFLTSSCCLILGVVNAIGAAHPLSHLFIGQYPRNGNGHFHIEFVEDDTVPFEPLKIDEEYWYEDDSQISKERTRRNTYDMDPYENPVGRKRYYMGGRNRNQQQKYMTRNLYDPKTGVATTYMDNLPVNPGITPSTNPTAYDRMGALEMDSPDMDRHSTDRPRKTKRPRINKATKEQIAQYAVSYGKEAAADHFHPIVGRRLSDKVVEKFIQLYQRRMNRRKDRVIGKSQNDKRGKRD